MSAARNLKYDHPASPKTHPSITDTDALAIDVRNDTKLWLLPTFISRERLQQHYALALSNYHALRGSSTMTQNYCLTVQTNYSANNRNNIKLNRYLFLTKTARNDFQPWRSEQWSLLSSSKIFRYIPPRLPASLGQAASPTPFLIRQFIYRRYVYLF